MGSVGPLRVPYYIESSHTASYATVPVAEIEEQWSNEEFLKHQKTTHKILGK